VRDRREPCDTPGFISVGEYILFLTEVPNFLFDRKELISLTVLPEKLNFRKSYNKPRYHAVSKAFRYPRIPQ